MRFLSALYIFWLWLGGWPGGGRQARNNMTRKKTTAHKYRYGFQIIVHRTGDMSPIADCVLKIVRNRRERDFPHGMRHEAKPNEASEVQESKYDL